VVWTGRRFARCSKRLWRGCPTWRSGRSSRRQSTRTWRISDCGPTDTIAFQDAQAAVVEADLRAGEAQAYRQVLEDTDVLYWRHQTPFIEELRRVRPFWLMLKTGAGRNPCGPVFFMVFWVPNPADPEEAFAATEAYLNPHDAVWVAR
jgi:hypothetical protein